jgi:cobaltochelatase CobN
VGIPLGQVGRIDDALAIPGLVFGNVFVGIQPPRGFGADPMAIYHSPDLPPTHHYLAYYRWLRDEFGAHAVLHMGKHGNLEWLPGKATALSAECYPEVMLGDLPNFYPYIINNPGEGTQAKRRAHAVIVDHLIPPMTQAETYDDLARWSSCSTNTTAWPRSTRSSCRTSRSRSGRSVTQNNLDRDLKVDRCPEAEAFDAFLQEIDGYLCELGDAQIRDGLHVFGEPPQGEQRVGLIQAMMRLDNGDIPSLRKAVARARGIESEWLVGPLGDPIPQEYKGHLIVRSHAPRGHAVLDAPRPEFADDAERRARHSHAERGNEEGDSIRTRGDMLDVIDEQSRLLLREVRSGDGIDDLRNLVDRLGVQTLEVLRCLQFVSREIIPRLDRTTDEITNLLRGLSGRFVPAGPSGAPTRGMARILPTGRNFYSVDIHTIPTETAWRVGVQAGDRLIEKYRAEHDGQYPRSVGIVVWGTSTMRTHGDDVAEILHLMGCRPVWVPESRRLTGVELVPLEELGRPRIDVTVRISGFFRDAFPNVVALLDAPSSWSRPPTSPTSRTPSAATSATRSGPSVLRPRCPSGLPPGALPRLRLEARLVRGRPAEPDRRAELEERRRPGRGLHPLGLVRLHGDGSRRRGPEPFKRRLSQVAVAVQNQDNREHDIFDSDDYFQFHGGMIAAIRALTGENPAAYFGDTANPDHVRVRDLADEARRVFRSRVVNPKWIASVMRHGYKGAFEMAATVDYLFGYEATAGVIDDWMFEDLSRAYLRDPQVQDFLQEKNPWALRSMAERLLEAVDRGLWEQPDPATVEALKSIYLRNESVLERR